MSDEAQGPCPFLSPEGPEGTDLASFLLKIDDGLRIILAPGAVLFDDEDRSVLRKIRRLKDGSVWVLIEFEDKSVVWTPLASKPTPPLTQFQEEEIERIKTNLSPLQILHKKVGDRVGCGKDRTGTIVLLAFREAYTDGTVVAVDDGSIQISQNVAELLREMDAIREARPIKAEGGP